MTHHSLSLHRYEDLKLVGTLFGLTEDELFTQNVPEFIEQDQFELSRACTNGQATGHSWLQANLRQLSTGLY